LAAFTIVIAAATIHERPSLNTPEMPMNFIILSRRFAAFLLLFVTILRHFFLAGIFSSSSSGFQADYSRRQFSALAGWFSRRYRRRRSFDIA